MTRLRIGSDEHKRRFCKAFVETFQAYDPLGIHWPVLDPAAQARLRALPFWGEAIGSERTAAARVRAMAEIEPDPLLREAIALQAYEEERHAQLLEALLGFYGIPAPDEPASWPRDPEWGFVRMGYGECFDSFFAFGLFRLAQDTGFFPEPLVRIFDGVMQEEARHILFFTNWVAYRTGHLPLLRKPAFLLRRGLAVALQAIGRARTAFELRGGGRDADNFTMQVPDELAGDEGVTLERLARTCLAESRRRLSPYDPELLRPRLVPDLVGMTLRVWPRGW